VQNLEAKEEEFRVFSFSSFAPVPPPPPPLVVVVSVVSVVVSKTVEGEESKRVVSSGRVLGFTILVITSFSFTD
jgi:hypothetical protein